MSNAAIGLFAGVLLAIVAAIGGLGYFLLAVLLGAVGVVVGLALDGRIDVNVGRRRG
jgi:uncharacterized membrane protein